MFRFLRLGIIFSVVVGSTTAWAVPLHEFSNGDHSFKSLGPNFYAEVPVRKIPDEDIQLVFVNYELAERLGIELPKDPVELEKLAKANFGWEVDPEKNPRNLGLQLIILIRLKKGRAKQWETAALFGPGK